MNRIEKSFAALKAEDRIGLVGFLTAGDPDLGQSERDIRTAVEHGVDVLELGIPFSDPTADGPTIQAASHRALSNGMTLEKTLELVSRLRADIETPIVLFGYANPFFTYGYDRFFQRAAEAGADGMLIVDLPFEEYGEVEEAMQHAGLIRIPLVAPTTPPRRLGRLLETARGFVYYIMVTGVTGARTDIASDLAAHVADLRSCTRLPIAVGFGVSSGRQAAELAPSADAVVVGSALIQAARKGHLAELVDELRRGLDGT